jgi:hypothetical protein
MVNRRLQEEATAGVIRIQRLLDSTSLYFNAKTFVRSVLRHFVLLDKF